MAASGSRPHLFSSSASMPMLPPIVGSSRSAATSAASSTLSSSPEAYHHPPHLPHHQHPQAFKRTRSDEGSLADPALYGGQGSDGAGTTVRNDTLPNRTVSLLDRPRRTGRACLQCRSRKQKCIVDATNDEDPHAPCKRCLRSRFECSFQEADDRGPAPVAPNVASNDVSTLFRQMQKHEGRIRALEEELAATRRSLIDVKMDEDAREEDNFGESALPTLAAVAAEDDKYRAVQAQSAQGHTSATSPPPAPAPSLPPPLSRSSSNETSSRMGMESLQLETPIATLRSLGAISQDGWRGRATKSPTLASSSFDPVSRGLITLDDAAQCVSTYATYCHVCAPLLDEEMLHCLPVLRRRPILFLSVCCVGARLWKSNPSDSLGLHPNYDALVELLDQRVSNLLLRPTSEDLTLASVQALLITTQWMPMVRSTGNPERYESRYSEISAGPLLGLVGRYAHSIGLEAASLPPFEGIKGERRAYKAWHNLLTCDANLMLTSGFPPSTQAAHAAQTALSLSSHGLTVSSEDVRVAALLELAAIAQRAIPQAGLLQDISRGVLEKYNAELDRWEKTWTAPLRERNVRQDQMPFNSLRWYRLSINSFVLRPLLSAPLTTTAWNLQYTSVEPLGHSLTAAARILVSYSRMGEQHLPSLQHHDPSSFPRGEGWKLNEEGIEKMCFSVDSHWVTLTFAVVFLALCYVRGRIDDQCALLFDKAPPSMPPPASIYSPLSSPSSSSSSKSTSHNAPPPLAPKVHRKVDPKTPFGHLLKLGLDIFRRVCQVAPGPHPAHDLKIVVENVVGSVLASSGPGKASHTGRKGPNVMRTGSGGSDINPNATSTGPIPSTLPPVQRLHLDTESGSNISNAPARNRAVSLSDFHSQARSHSFSHILHPSYSYGPSSSSLDKDREKSVHSVGRAGGSTAADEHGSSSTPLADTRSGPSPSRGDETTSSPRERLYSRSPRNETNVDMLTRSSSEYHDASHHHHHQQQQEHEHQQQENQHQHQHQPQDVQQRSEYQTTSSGTHVTQTETLALHKRLDGSGLQWLGEIWDTMMGGVR